jgi:hypothetical protein
MRIGLGMFRRGQRFGRVRVHCRRSARQALGFGAQSLSARDEVPVIALRGARLEGSDRLERASAIAQPEARHREVEPGARLLSQG